MHSPTAFTLGLCGGTACGKGWFVERLRHALPEGAIAHLCFDSWYRDLGHLSPAERARQNFDHPASLDEGGFAGALRRLRGGLAAEVPRYDFATHRRLEAVDRIEAAPIVIADGILLLHFDEIRALLDERWFLDVDADLRLRRRIHRDSAERGRTEEMVRTQWANTVAPMHELFVAPSKAWSTKVLHGPSEIEAAVEPTIRRLWGILAK